MSHQTEAVRRLYEMMAEYCNAPDQRLIDSLGVLKTFHSTVLNNLLLNSDATAKARLDILGVYASMMANDLDQIRTLLASGLH